MTERARRDGSWSRTRRGGLLLVALCLLAYLPGLWSVPPVDRDESRFAQASRQVMEARDLEGRLVPKIQDRPRLNKPPLIYWLQGAVGWAVDRDPEGASPRHQRIGWYRLPSVLCAILATLATWRAGCLLYRRDEGFIGALMLALCPMVLWDARQARADELLLACTAGAMWALASIWTTHRRGGSVGVAKPLALWVCVGLGVMAKGPVTPMVVFLALGALWVAGPSWRFVRTTKPLLGLVVVLALVLPWLLSVSAIVGWSDYWSIVFDETLGRAGSAKESHWGPPGYHLFLLPALFFPGSLVTLDALLRARRRVRRRKRWTPSPELFLLAWVVPAWIVFEAVMTKLPHYTLVLYPALALLSARALVVFARARRAIGAPGLTIWLVLGLALCAAPLALSLIFDPGAWHVPALAGLIGAVCFATLAGVVPRLHAGALRELVPAIPVIMVPVSWALFAVVLPRVDALWPSSAAAEAIVRIDPDGDRPVARTGYHEDSLVFLTRGRAERVGRNRLAEWFLEHPDGLAIVSDDVPAPIGTTIAGLIGGFNYSTGEPVRLRLLRAVTRRTATIPDPPDAPAPNG